MIHFPGFRLKSTRSLAEGRFPREFFYFFLKSESDISARSFVKSSRLPEESVILYRFWCPVKGSRHRKVIFFAWRQSFRGDETDGTTNTDFPLWYKVGIEKFKLSKKSFDGYEDSFCWGYYGRLIWLDGLS